jgi:tetratricopeptide (TPR) repeat protein
MNEDSFPDYLISPEAKKYFELAYKHQMEGDLDKAVFFYKKSLETEKTAEAYTFLGWTYSFMGKYQKAIDECLKAIDVDPDFGNPYNDIGSYYMSLGRLDDAVLWLKKAKKAKRYISPEFAYVNLGRVYELKGLFFEAMEEYREALKVNSSYQPAKSALGRLEALLN